MGNKGSSSVAVLLVPLPLVGAEVAAESEEAVEFGETLGPGRPRITQLMQTT